MGYLVFVQKPPKNKQTFFSEYGMSYLTQKAPVTLSTLQKLKKSGEKFSCLTCYDASFAHLMAQAQIETILVGDSLGMVVQGHDSTLPVRMQDMVYHTQNIKRANRHALIIADLPFMSYASVADAIQNSRAVMQAGAHVVKIEGDGELSERVRILTQNGVPVCVHLGLTPQSVNVLGGYKVQGKTDTAAQKLLDDCQALVQAGAAMLLLECVPAALAKTITQSVSVPVIGIGAGVDTDGQVLVMHDMLGVYMNKPAKFVHNFLADSGDILGAFCVYHQAVKAQQFPSAEHSF